MPDTPLLKVDDLAVHFRLPVPLAERAMGKKPTTLKAVDGVSFEIGKGLTLSVVGESGCGKSTVARLIAGLFRPTRGDITIDGANVTASKNRTRAIRRRLTMIFQDPQASLNPRWRVHDIIAEPVKAFGIARDKGDIKREVDKLLEQVGLSSADGEKYPHEFSGGQRQRISIARALASKPDLILCDEPTSALDVSVQAQILNLMRDLQDDLGLTYLFISHDLAVVHHMSDRVAVMYLGRFVEVTEAPTLFSTPRHPYTQLLLETIPDLTMANRDREPVAGEVPSPINPPSGCAFHPRCPHVNDRCRTERPKLLSINKTAVACHAVEESRIPSV
ncbi:MAG: ATP-binding cassette domain-containing protein [Rhodospirillaceae bacterium]|nr:ATP-binding cassette domain-containing protein [Rhodospirillaceae bacterium]MCY4310683.1 ATP-binding cassette domain-containing protein [Rhodospirillaceae bacterium]